MTRARAIWTSDCDAILLDTLFKERQEGRQADNAGWHTSAWNAAETALAGTEAHTGGSPKTAQSCQTRWSTLKKEYKDVKQIRELSGFGWDADKNLAVAGDNIWDNYIKAHPKQKKWRKTSFPHFDDMADLIEGTYATGKGVFRPGEPNSDSSEGKEDSTDPDPSQPIPTSTPPSNDTTSASLITPASPPPTATAPMLSTMTDTAACASKRSRNHRKTGSQAIEGMASSISRLAEAFAADTVIPSPARKRSAIHTIEDDGDLSDDEQLRVFKIIRRDTGFADTILAIRKKTARTRFIKAELYGEAED